MPWTQHSADRRIRHRQPCRFASVASAMVLVLVWAASSASAKPRLVLDVGQHAEVGEPLTVPIGLSFHDTTITALIFSIDLDNDSLSFDPTDGDGDGIPDSVTLPAGMPSVVFVDHDPTDLGGELDVMLLNLSGAPLPRGIVLELTFEPLASGYVAHWIRYSNDPWPSFGDHQGHQIDGWILVAGGEIFADGFESGDLSGWSSFTE